jgi:hypothetical protein
VRQADGDLADQVIVKQRCQLTERGVRARRRPPADLKTVRQNGNTHR